MHCCRLSLLVVLLLGPLFGTTAHAQLASNADRRADEHLNGADQLFRDAKYHEAIDELRAGYTLSPQPRFLVTPSLFTPSERPAPYEW